MANVGGGPVGTAADHSQNTLGFDQQANQELGHLATELQTAVNQLDWSGVRRVLSLLKVLADA